MAKSSNPAVVSGEIDQPASAAACELCGRVQLPLTRHHLIPQSQHQRNRAKRRFDRDEMQTSIALLCRPCHSQLHAVLDNSQLVLAYHSIEALQTHPEIAKFAAWIANKPSGLKVTIRKPK
jgi:hypothetical protein